MDVKSVHAAAFCVEIVVQGCEVRCRECEPACASDFRCAGFPPCGDADGGPENAAGRASSCLARPAAVL